MPRKKNAFLAVVILAISIVSLIELNRALGLHQAGQSNVEQLMTLELPSDIHDNLKSNRSQVAENGESKEEYTAVSFLLGNNGSMTRENDAPSTELEVKTEEPLLNVSSTLPEVTTQSSPIREIPRTRTTKILRNNTAASPSWLNFVPKQHLLGERYLPYIPSRSESDKDIARLCVQAGEGGIYLKHFRKAGGTSVARSIKNAACDERKSPPKPAFGSELPFFNSKVFVSRGGSILGSTVFVTAMRHPVDRIMSMYWFEGRWPRTCGLECERKRIKNNATKVADLDEWTEKVLTQTDHRRLQYIRHNSCGQWISVENYYIRMLLGVDAAKSTKEKSLTPYNRGFLNITLTRRHLEQAKRVLDNFDLVIIQEQMSRPSNMSYMFHSIIGSPTRNPYMMQFLRKGEEKKDLYEEPSNAELDRLRSLNVLDIELYEYAVQLSEKTVKKWLAAQEPEAPKKKVVENFNAATDCKKPDKIPPVEVTKKAVSGDGCSGINKSFFYYLGDCMLHSFGPKK